MDKNPMLEQWIAQQLESNPQLRSMYQWVQQNSNQTEEEQPPASSISLIEHRNKMSKALAQIKKMKKAIDALNESLKTMEAFHEDLAHALGACPFCWGEDETCRACRGRGKPGAFEPDKALFQALVLPATKRFTKKQQHHQP